MKRFSVTPRKDWQTTVESQGLFHHTAENGTYWNESAYYSFWMDEILAIEAATKQLQEMCLAAGQYIIDNNLFKKMNIGQDAETLIRETWDEEPPALYGRFDLAYDGKDIKLLEYNADTPTSLIEAAVIQWYWLRDVFPTKDQFNSLHEKLITKWKDILEYIKHDPIYFTSMVNREDAMTIAYLAETANQAGAQTHRISIADIGLTSKGRFVDMENNIINVMFKLYPWENLLQDEFGKNIMDSGIYLIEPAWKMMWSNKAILAILWEMYPNHPLLLPAYFAPDGFIDPVAPPSSFFEDMGSFVRKPFISREGENVVIYEAGEETLSTPGTYEGPYVYQKLAKLAKFDDKYPILGSWVVDGVPAGMGIREDRSLITGNLSQFVPHAIE